MAARTRQLLAVEIREERASGFTPLAGGKPRVDRAKGIIYGVKVVGRESPNTHDQPGVTKGTRYTPEALRQEIEIIRRGCVVNVNHPAERKVRVDREAEDRLGKLLEPLLYEGEVYADLHLLLTHPMSERLMEAAERMPEMFALSHNARGDGPVIDGVWVIETIGSVKSVDVVADGGTNRSLYESRQVTKIKLKELCESKPAMTGAKTLGRLLEICPLAGGLLVEAEDDGGDYRDHLHAAKKMCEDAGDGDMAGKIHGLMKPKKDDEEETEESEEEDAGAAKKEDEKAKKEGEDDAGDKAKMESRLHELEAKDACRTLCESLGFVPTPLQLKALAPLAAADRKDFVKELKAARGAGGTRSRSLIAAPKDKGGDVLESAGDVPAKTDDQLNWLRS